MRLALACLAVTALAAEAQTWAPGPEAAARLESGRPYVEVRADPSGATGVVRAGIDIAAPRDVVWEVVTDCELAPRMVASLASCRILERDPAGGWDVREHISRPLILPPVRSVFRSEYQRPSKIVFRKAGGDLRVLEGEWRLEPLGGGTATRVLYEQRAGFPYRTPAALVRIGMRREVPQALLALRREALARAGR
jgi:uncharacterized protein YndB with AHSA1/START domain